jgi:uncharacterized membrane protein YkoI
MRHLHRIKARLAGFCAMLLLTVGGIVAAAHAGETHTALTAEHIIACVRTAVAAQAGLIREVEVKHKRGQWLCEVDLVDDSGQEFEVDVDVATDQVVRTKRD